MPALVAGINGPPPPSSWPHLPGLVPGIRASGHLHQPPPFVMPALARTRSGYAGIHTLGRTRLRKWMPRTPPDLIRGPGMTTQGGGRAEGTPRAGSGTLRPIDSMRDSPGFAGINWDKWDKAGFHEPRTCLPSLPRSSPLAHIMPRSSHTRSAPCTVPWSGSCEPEVAHA